MKVLKKAGTAVVSVILWAVILVAALYAFTTMATRDNQNVANLLGYTPMAVQSDSMAPTFDKGDLFFEERWPNCGGYAIGYDVSAGRGYYAYAHH